MPPPLRSRPVKAYTYRPEILAALARRGIVPKSTTDPEKLRELVNDLYVFEIREAKLRRRELEAVMGPQPPGSYRERVIALKEKYRPLLGLPAEAWVLHATNEVGATGNRPA